MKVFVKIPWSIYFTLATFHLYLIQICRKRFCLQLKKNKQFKEKLFFLNWLINLFSTVDLLNHNCIEPYQLHDKIDRIEFKTLRTWGVGADHQRQKLKRIYKN